MKNVTHFLKSLLHPSVSKTLKTFQKKINQLDTRIDLIVDEINLSDAAIEKLCYRQKVLTREIEIAEKARDALTEIVITRLAYCIQPGDEIIQNSSHKEAKVYINTERVVTDATFVAHEHVQAGDYIVYLNDEDIYHCSKTVFEERNIVN
jgi:hypothetical protein